MLNELHKAGFQRLRGMPYMSDSGAYWRLEIGPASLFFRNHGALLDDAASDNIWRDAASGNQDAVVARYTSGMAKDGAYFGWRDAAKDDARQLAAKFVERFPRLASMGMGRDHAYAGWFLYMLGLAERGWLPVVFSNSHVPTSSDIMLFDMRSPDWANDGEAPPRLPLPPAGELDRNSDLVDLDP
jgi:hypothetical protein